MWKFHQYLCNKQNITWPLGNTNFIFSCWKYLSLVRCAHSWEQHLKIKFVSLHGHVIASIIYINGWWRCYYCTTLKGAWVWWPNKPFGFLVEPHVTCWFYIWYRRGDRKKTETKNIVKNNNCSKARYGRGTIDKSRDNAIYIFVNTHIYHWSETNLIYHFTYTYKVVFALVHNVHRMWE